MDEKEKFLEQKAQLLMKEARDSDEKFKKTHREEYDFFKKEKALQNLEWSLRRMLREEPTENRELFEIDIVRNYEEYENLPEGKRPQMYGDVQISHPDEKKMYQLLSEIIKKHKIISS